MPDKPNIAEPQKPRRRWFQFRLRTLLIVTAIVAVLCAWLASAFQAGYERAHRFDAPANAAKP